MSKGARQPGSACERVQECGSEGQDEDKLIGDEDGRRKEEGEPWRRRDGHFGRFVPHFGGGYVMTHHSSAILQARERSKEGTPRPCTLAYSPLAACSAEYLFDTSRTGAFCIRPRFRCFVSGDRHPHVVIHRRFALASRGRYLSPRPDRPARQYLTAPVVDPKLSLRPISCHATPPIHEYGRRNTQYAIRHSA